MVDRIGWALVGAAAAWTVVSAAAGGGNPVPVLFTLALAAAAVVSGRLLRWEDRPAMPAVVAAAAVLLALASVGTLFSARGSAGPFGYANAKGAFFWQAALAAAIVASTWIRAWVRIAGGTAAVLFAAVAASSGRMSVAVVVGMLPLAAVALAGRRAARPVVAVAALAFAAVLSYTVAVAADAEALATTRLGREVVPRLDERGPLWQEAVTLIRRNPVVGVGPFRFQEASATARSDPDLRWVHHGFLQQGAEGGTPATALLVLGFAWGFAGLWANPDRDRSTGLAAVGLASLGAHASVDYILHFPAVVVAAAALVGAGQARAGRRPEVSPGPLLRKTAKAAVLPAGLVARRSPSDLVILLYHRVGVGSREVDLPVEAFEEQVAAMAEDGRVRSIDDAVTDPGAGGVVVSVDDGYRDFHQNVLPALARHRVPAVLYLATGLVDGDGGRGGEALTWGQLEEAVSTGLVSVGSHTHGHVDVSRAPEAVVREELRRSKELIEDRLGVPCRHFAYPWGVASATSDRVARRLFHTAALGWQTNRSGRIEPYRLGRTPVLRSDGPVFFRAKLRGLLDGEAMVYRLAQRGPWRAVP